MANYLKVGAGAASGSQTIIDKNEALASGSRAAGDFVNGTHRDPICDAILSVYFNTTAPSAESVIAELYLLYGDGNSPEAFPIGGDGSVGDDYTPQSALLVDTFETVNPSTSAAERLQIPEILLCPFTNRFVIRNVSAQEFNLTWQLDIVTRRLVAETS